MKKITKITLIISIAFIILGTSLMIGSGLLDDLYYGNEELNIGPVGIRMKEAVEIANDETQELDISVKAASLEILCDDTIDGITITDSSEYFDVIHSVEGDELQLEIRKKDRYKSAVNLESAKVTLMIPIQMYFEEMKIDVDAGEISADRLAAKKLGIKMNASSTEIRDMDVGELEVDNNAGALWLYGTAERKLDVDCNAGTVEMRLNASYNDFNYDVDCNVGEICVDNREYSGLKSSVSMKNEGAQRIMDLDCNMGNIDVQFDNRQDD